MKLHESKTENMIDSLVTPIKYLYNYAEESDDLAILLVTFDKSDTLAASQTLGILRKSW